MGFFKEWGKFMMAGAVAHARWEIDVSNTVFRDKKRLLLLALLLVPVFLGGYVYADQIGGALPEVLGGKKAYSPAYYSTGIFIVSILIGLGAGLITGCIGAGGGFIIAPALMSAGMSPGEYMYLYSLAFYVMRGNSPADGPPYVFLGPSNAKEDGFSWQGPRENEDISKVRRNRELRIRKRTNGFLLQMLTNQLKAIDEETDQQENIDRAAWREMVAAELDTMKIDEGFRLLWESALPDPIVNSMEPFSTRLEASYGSLTNVVEMGMNQVE